MMMQIDDDPRPIDHTTWLAGCTPFCTHTLDQQSPCLAQCAARGMWVDCQLSSAQQQRHQLPGGAGECTLCHALFMQRSSALCSIQVPVHFPSLRCM
jgi:hypothetical protein